MRIHRIYYPDKLDPDQRVRLDAASSHYLARVLRVVTGQALVLFNGDGHDYAAEVESAAKSGVEALVSARLPARAESPLRTTLVQALARGERMDFAMQKATELGVTAIQPLATARTEVRIKPDKLQARMSHWQKVIISACEQCGRARLPQLFEPLGLADWAMQSGQDLRVVLAPGAEQSLAALQPVAGIQILVGPEGGFEDTELDFLHRTGVQAVAMGPRILRTETAGATALAILQATMGDFQ